MNDKEKLIYIAGMLDLRGTFFMSRYYKSEKNIYKYIGGMQINITSKEIGDFIYNLCDPHPNIKSVRNDNCYRMIFRQKSLDAFLPRIIPFLLFKKIHAELLLKYRETYKVKFSRKGMIGYVHVPQEIEEIRRHCFEELRRLNGLYTQ